MVNIESLTENKNNKRRKNDEKIPEEFRKVIKLYYDVDEIECKQWGRQLRRKENE